MWQHGALFTVSWVGSPHCHSLVTEQLIPHKHVTTITVRSRGASSTQDVDKGKQYMVPLTPLPLSNCSTWSFVVLVQHTRQHINCFSCVQTRTSKNCRNNIPPPKSASDYYRTGTTSTSTHNTCGLHINFENIMNTSLWSLLFNKVVSHFSGPAMWACRMCVGATF